MEYMNGYLGFFGIFFVYSIVNKSSTYELQ